jgi:hypothetical protein
MFNEDCAMSGRYLLDTNILIDLLEGNEAVSGLGGIARMPTAPSYGFRASGPGGTDA